MLNRTKFLALGAGVSAIALFLAPTVFTKNNDVADTRLKPDQIMSAEEWYEQGSEAVAKRAAQKLNTNRAKNVILFVGDGMGVSTLTAARIFQGQMNGNPGEENYLSFERFPNSALVKTYNVDAQVADSAGTASALNTGVKTRIGVINTNPNHPNDVCEGSMDAPLKTTAYYAEKAGMATGVISTARLTHATPAAVYAHAANRDWEDDSELPDGADACMDIASQITDDLGGNGLEVALGGGRRNFLPEAMDGRREDGKNIVEEWKSKWPNTRYVEDQKSLMATDFAKTDKLFGLFSDSHMEFEADRAESDQPHIADMTEAAIKILSKNDNGFYLMVEGGRVDHAHHGGNAHRALTDAVALSDAVERAMSLVDMDETLILVTADHSHVFTIAGYPARGNPILGLVSPPHEEGELTEAKDDKPYTTLGYHNGPGAIDGERETLTQNQVLDKDFKQQAAISTWSETHGGEDVALFAKGPWSHLARGTIEQNEIFHIIRHALDMDNR